MKTNISHLAAGVLIALGCSSIASAASLNLQRGLFDQPDVKLAHSLEAEVDFSLNSDGASLSGVEIEVLEAASGEKLNLLPGKYKFREGSYRIRITKRDTDYQVIEDYLTLGSSSRERRSYDRPRFRSPFSQFNFMNVSLISSFLGDGYKVANPDKFHLDKLNVANSESDTVDYGSTSLTTSTSIGVAAYGAQLTGKHNWMYDYGFEFTTDGKLSRYHLNGGTGFHFPMGKYVFWSTLGVDLGYDQWGVDKYDTASGSTAIKSGMFKLGSYLMLGAAERKGGMSAHLKYDFLASAATAGLGWNFGSEARLYKLPPKLVLNAPDEDVVFKENASDEEVSKKDEGFFKNYLNEHFSFKPRVRFGASYATVTPDLGSEVETYRLQNSVAGYSTKLKVVDSLSLTLRMHWNILGDLEDTNTIEFRPRTQLVGVNNPKAGFLAYGRGLTAYASVGGSLLGQTMYTYYDYRNVLDARFNRHMANTIFYGSPNINGLRLRVSYTQGEADDELFYSDKYPDGTMLSASASYKTAPGLRVFVAYQENADYQNVFFNTMSTKLGMNMRAGAARLTLAYETTGDDNPRNNLLAAVKNRINEIEIGAMYGLSTSDDFVDDNEFLAARAGVKMNKHMTAYINYVMGSANGLSYSSGFAGDTSILMASIEFKN